MNSQDEKKVFSHFYARLKKPYQQKLAIGLIHKIYLSQVKSSRAYTASTKTKSEVRGGGRKPWKQKGTGRARAGSSRSPLWVGGGVSFGPKPRVVKKKVNKKEKRLGLLEALLLKAKQIRFYQGLAYNNGFISTQKISTLLNEQNSPLTNASKNYLEKSLIIASKPNPCLWLSTRALKNVKVVHVACLSLRQIIEAKFIFIESHALNLLFYQPS
uniref:Large ribosomal subunit protein uL4c n=1 Tax=Spumella sp. Baekdong012001B8 TaxID=2782410 RepID=A0A7S6TCT4_9STRA|nr:ribosomal protein L4 [Spumella sp. Baekdong012001B8]